MSAWCPIAGAVLLANALTDVPHITLTPWLVVLSALTVISSRFRIEVPGHSASVSVPEFFIFGSILLYGPVPAMLVGGVDGFFISTPSAVPAGLSHVLQRRRAPISIAGAAGAFYTAQGLIAGWGVHGSLDAAAAARVAMAAASSASTACCSPRRWRSESGAARPAVEAARALPRDELHAAASIAVLVFATEGGVNVIGLVVPLLALSFAAYKAVVNRIEAPTITCTEVEGLYRATVETLAIAVDAKDQVTHGHIRRVQRHTVAVARALGVSEPLELRALEAASLLHDVGKLAVPDYVLNKPGALNHAEFERMKQHAAKGAEILEAVDFPCGRADRAASPRAVEWPRVIPTASPAKTSRSARACSRWSTASTRLLPIAVSPQDVRRPGHRHPARPPRHDVRSAHRRRVHRPDSGPARGGSTDRSAATRDHA